MIIINHYRSAEHTCRPLAGLACIVHTSMYLSYVHRREQTETRPHEAEMELCIISISTIRTEYICTICSGDARVIARIQKNKNHVTLVNLHPTKIVPN